MVKIIYLWGTPIVATVEEIVYDIKHEILGTGLLKDITDTGSDIMATCPFHKGGMERKPSLGISKGEVERDGKKFEAGTTHCYT